MSERLWYQNGWVIIGILAFIAWLSPVLHQAWRESQMVHVRPQIAGCVNQPAFGEPSLEVDVWHQHSGNLRNGTFMVSVETDLLKNPDGEESKMHSFETWESNRENAVKFVFPLRRFDPKQEIEVSLLLAGKRISTYFYTDAWVGDDWKSNQQADQE